MNEYYKKICFDEDVQIIELSEESIKNNISSCGNSFIKITKEMIRALQDGKCISHFDGEYSNFIILEQ